VDGEGQIVSRDALEASLTRIAEEAETETNGQAVEGARQRA
jgi:hypothetical protein